MFEEEKGLNWLYIDLNSYFATIEQQIDASIRQKPVVVVPLLSDSTCAIAASYEAKLLGIKTGTKIYEAKKLCPDLVCVPARHKLYVKYHKLIFAEISKFLYIDHVCSIDEGAGKLTGKYRQEEEAISLGNKIKASIKQNVGDYINCSIGIAPSRYLAKIAVDMQKPDGMTVIRLEDIPAKLYKLNLRDIPGVGYKMYKKIKLAGIDTVEQLYTCGSYQLQNIWGNVHGKKLWYLLRGYELPDYAVKNKALGHSRVIAPQDRKISTTRNVAIELIIKAAKRLREARLYATYINLYIKTNNRIKYKSHIKITPSCDNVVILKQLIKMWEDLIQDQKIISVHQVAVSLSGLIEKPAQLTFEEFGNINKGDLKKRDLSKTMDIINNKYGKTIVNLGIITSKDRDPIAFGHIPDSKKEEYLN